MDWTFGMAVGIIFLDMFTNTDVPGLSAVDATQQWAQTAFIIIGTIYFMLKGYDDWKMRKLERREKKRNIELLEKKLNL
jgi:threonine/homoserine/homoserine lactone efflux protein